MEERYDRHHSALNLACSRCEARILRQRRQLRAHRESRAQWRRRAHRARQLDHRVHDRIAPARTLVSSRALSVPADGLPIAHRNCSTAICAPCMPKKFWSRSNTSAGPLSRFWRAAPKTRHCERMRSVAIHQRRKRRAELRSEPNTLPGPSRCSVADVSRRIAARLHAINDRYADMPRTPPFGCRNDRVEKKSSKRSGVRNRSVNR